MSKTDKELAVDLTCVMIQEFSSIAMKRNITASPHSKEQLIEMVNYFTKELSKIKSL